MDDNFTRYSRQIFIDQIGVKGQRKINSAKVLVVGAGGLGSPVIAYLSAAGVGTLGVMDFDVVELHNLNRQVIHQSSSVGQSKVKSAERFVKAINNQVNFVGISEKLTPNNAKEILSDYDIVVDCCDNFATRYLINDTCVYLDKPLVYGSILSFEGQVAIFNYKGSKHLRDLFDYSASLNQQEDCDSKGVLGPLPGIVGSMMSMQVLQIICDLKVSINTLTLIDTLNWNFTKIEF